MLRDSQFRKAIVLWAVLAMSMMALTVVAPDYESTESAEVEIEEHDTHCADFDYLTVELEESGSYEKAYVYVDGHKSPVIDTVGETVTVLNVNQGDEVSVVGVEKSGEREVFRTYEHEV